MGIVLVARRLTRDEYDQVRADPGMAPRLLDGGEGGDDRLIDIDKSWHAIHYLLTGTAWLVTGDAGLAVLGGEPLGEELGYGPARVLSPEQVRRVSEVLSATDEDTLRQKYDPGRLTRLDIYPRIWDEHGVLDEYVLPNYARLVAFYAKAAAENQAVLLALT